MSKTEILKDSIEMCYLRPYEIVKKLPPYNLEDVQIDEPLEEICKKNTFISKLVNMFVKLFT
jgi:hypothetical protein